jgi:ABC-type transport system substrate-binding protein
MEFNVISQMVKISTLIDNVKVKDKYTVELNLKEAYQPALAELAMPRPYVFVQPMQVDMLLSNSIQPCTYL